MGQAGSGGTWSAERTQMSAGARGGGAPDFGEAGVVPDMAAPHLHPESGFEAASLSGFVGVG